MIAPGVSIGHGSRRRFGVARFGRAGATAKSLTGFFAFFGGHLLPPLGHSPAAVGTMRAAHTKAAEQNPAESQQADSLPEGNLAPSEQRRQQPVPQMHHECAADHDEKSDSQRGQKSDP